MKRIFKRILLGFSLLFFSVSSYAEMTISQYELLRDKENSEENYKNILSFHLQGIANGILWTNTKIKHLGRLPLLCEPTFTNVHRSHDRTSYGS